MPMPYLTLALALAPAFAQAQVLEVAGTSGMQRLGPDQLKALAGGLRSMTVLEPHEGDKRNYIGVPASALLQALFGNAWRDAGAVLFECADGYRALIEPSKLAEHRALLSWARGDGQPFALVNRLQNGEAVELAPFYLVWDNLESPRLRAQGASDWPYQVVGIALVSLAERLPRVMPPPGTDEAVLRGFEAFRTHCLTCHSINGQGGSKAPELNVPSSVTEYLAEGWLRRWILEPTKVRLNTPMPPLAPGLREARREALAGDIEAYLRAMAQTKRLR